MSASCLLRAFAADHAVVGELTVPVGAGDQPTAPVTSTVRTERGATTRRAGRVHAPPASAPR